MSIFPTKILLATDGSKEAELADATNSTLHIIYVEWSPKFLENGPRGRDYNRTVYEELEEESGKMLRKLTWRVKVAGGTVARAHVRMGRADHEIVAVAEELGAGLIVMGSRGRGRIRRALMGSVSDSVVRLAHCPVLVVRAREAMSSRNEKRAESSWTSSLDLPREGNQP